MRSSRHLHRRSHETIKKSSNPFKKTSINYLENRLIKNVLLMKIENFTNRMSVRAAPRFFR